MNTGYTTEPGDHLVSSMRRAWSSSARRASVPDAVSVNTRSNSSRRYP
jgi:hypothetical protein